MAVIHRGDHVGAASPGQRAGASSGRDVWIEGGRVLNLLRIPLDGGGWILVEGDDKADQGPIPAGRVGDLITDGTRTLREALEPVAQASRTVLEELRKATPDEVEVEFGVELKAESGAVIAKAGSGCHLTVKLTWRDDPHSAAAGIGPAG
jgi:hypothetical protein